MELAIKETSKVLIKKLRHQQEKLNHSTMKDIEIRHTIKTRSCLQFHRYSTFHDLYRFKYIYKVTNKHSVFLFRENVIANFGLSYLFYNRNVANKREERTARKLILAKKMCEGSHAYTLKINRASFIPK